MFAPHVTSPLRLAAALAISLLLHGAALWIEATQPPVAQSAAPLQIDLPLPPPIAAPKITETPEDPLLKNTLDADKTPQQTQAQRATPITTQSGKVSAATAETRAVAAARRKIAKLLFYPPQAIAAGLEGEVRIVLTLDAAGQVQAADIAVSSGHALLDRAALQAAYAMGHVEADGRRELLLPVQFKLR